MPTFIIKDLPTNAPIPVQNLAAQINSLTVVRREDLQAAHWELFLHATNGGTIKVDLMSTAYRVLYGATIFLGNGGSSESLTLAAPKSLGEMIEAVRQVGARRGDWTGTDAYNCQDFVIAFMMQIGMSNSQIFKYELRRRATKHFPPTITERVEGAVQTRI
jgi:hypothetical protein